MRDRVAVIIGIIILVLGFLVLFTPIEFEMLLEFLPLSLAGIVVLSLGLLLIVIGVISYIGERL